MVKYKSYMISNLVCNTYIKKVEALYRKLSCHNQCHIQCHDNQNVHKPDAVFDVKCLLQ